MRCVWDFLKKAKDGIGCPKGVVTGNCELSDMSIRDKTSVYSIQIFQYFKSIEIALKAKSFLQLLQP